MKNNQFYVVQGWMLNELGLTGNELVCYATIYGFCQDGESVFRGTATYIAECVGCSRVSATTILKRLTEKGLIIKHEQEKTNIPAYSINWDLLRNFTGSVNNLYRGCKETLQDINRDNIDIKENKNNKLFLSKKTDEFDKRTMELWNEIADKYKLAKVSLITEKRHTALLARMKDIGVCELEEFFDKIRKAIKESTFLRGKEYVQTGNGYESRNKEWRCDYDFFLQQKSLVRAIEGGYADPDLVTR